MAQNLDTNGIGRTEIVRHDLDDQREAIQVRVDFGSHAAFPRHAHPGVGIAHVLSGTIVYELDGKQVKLEPGDTIATELATYIVGRSPRPVAGMVTLSWQRPAG